MLRLHAPRWGRLAPQTRAFSTPSSSQRERLPQSGPWTLLKTFVQSRSVVNTYRKQGLFAPNLSSVACLVVFGISQLPLNAPVDLPEFLDGSATAVTSVLQAANSEDFSRYAVARGRGGSASKLPKSANAKLLRKWCSPRCFMELEAGVRQTWARKCMVEMASVEVDRIFLVRASYDRVTDRELAIDRNLAQEVVVHRRWSSGSTIERLEMHVGFVTTERTKQTLVDQNKVRVVDSKWFYTAKLLSRVTSHEEVDWCITSMKANRMLAEEVISESVLRK